MVDGVGADEFLSDRDLHGLTHDRNLHLAAAVLGSDPIAGAGEADAARRIDLASTDTDEADGRWGAS